MSQEIQQMFDGIAHKYDFMNHFLSLNRDKKWRDQAISLLGSTLPGPLVLDLCGGTGDFQEALLQKHPQARPLVGDFSEPMLRVSKQKFSQIPAIQLDATKLPFQDQSADIALNAFGMRNLDSTELGLSEVARVLKSGGKFVTLEFFKPHNWFTRFFYATGVLLFPIFGKLLAGGKAEAYKYLAESVQKYLTTREYGALAQKVGFKVESMIPCDGGIAWIIVLAKA
jgi:demethylmenaquinone methyltransferase / 2-methoxy-6-polyprenyl-1,4-benzoquinol methylase